jgi:hypothetical protein
MAGGKVVFEHEGKNAFAIQGWHGHQSLAITKGYCAPRLIGSRTGSRRASPALGGGDWQTEALKGHGSHGRDPPRWPSSIVRLASVPRALSAACGYRAQIDNGTRYVDLAVACHK